jgi:hypothetical protein
VICNLGHEQNNSMVACSVSAHERTCQG